MPPLTHRAGSCDYGPCPNIFDYKPKPEMVAIQGTRLADPEALAQLKDMPSHETVVLIPRYATAGVRPHDPPGGTASMNFAEFDAWFDRFEWSTFRLETLQRYSVSGEDKRLRAFREGTPRPERSVRNDPWLRRIALTTAAGKRWQRVHLVEPPLTEYLRYELVSYVESAATGEDIWIAERAAHPDLAELNEDFWLFDADNERAYALLMRYDQEGHFLGYDHTTDPNTMDRCRAQRDLALEHAVKLNTYLASVKEVSRAG